jgi:hypothetical protein
MNGETTKYTHEKRGLSNANTRGGFGASFKDFEDAIQHFTAKAEGDVSAIITRNKADYAGSEIPVLSPDEFLAMREPSAE